MAPRAFLPRFGPPGVHDHQERQHRNRRSLPAGRRAGSRPCLSAVDGFEGHLPGSIYQGLLRDVLSIPTPNSPTTSLVDQFRRMSPQQASERRAKAYRANPSYDADPRDQATPAAMLELLCRIWREDGVSRSARSMLLSMMEQCTTGSKRIRGRLPDWKASRDASMYSAIPNLTGNGCKEAGSDNPVFLS